ncbi:MAG: hypothetical protein QHJ73_04165, partial [Armatimonadota bacterium]|nr:hypothetical protein [Armatimonadota bacterium]
AIRAYRQLSAEGKTPEEQKKNRQQALEMFQQALNEPYDGTLRAAIYYAMGSIYNQENNWEKAAEMFGLAVNEGPSPEIYMALGDAQRKLKKTQAALESYKEASAMANDTSSQQHYFTHLMLRSVFNEMKETKLAAAEQAWIDEFMKQQGGLGFPGGTFTVR